MKLHNTLTHQLDEFIPQNPGRVAIYTCGPTVYNQPHIGNWVTYIRWDTLVRVLRLSGYRVERVMNITDVGHLTSDADEGEDKIEKGAKREGITAWEIAARYTQDFIEGMRTLNLLPPEHIPHATSHIAEQIELVKILETKGYAYKTSDGIYYDTSKFARYADFAQLKLDEQEAGARVAFNAEKHSASDFALWKFSPTNYTRDMEWDSPWGKGFPGWHLECSAMSAKYLGDTLDIHTGGIDHIPVHHTNEIAQSEAATGKRFANYWLHANFLLVNGTKISKSLHNGYTLQQLADRDFTPMDFRLLVLQSHYRTESNFTWDNLAAARNRLHNLRAMADLRWQPSPDINDEIDFRKYETLMLQHLQDDMNTPLALSALSELSDLLQGKISMAQIPAFTGFLRFMDAALGLGLLGSADLTTTQKQLLAERETARAQKDFAASDTLRDNLLGQGIGLRDTHHGVVWFRI